VLKVRLLNAASSRFVMSMKCYRQGRKYRSDEW